MSKHIFNKEEKHKIEEAVKAAERESCGEIVPFYVASSDDYSEASYYLSFILSTLVSLLILGLSYTWSLPFQMTPIEVSATILGAAIIGYVIPVFVPSTKRWVIAQSKQEQRVAQRANEAFLTEKVFQTEDRIGILIFISHLEHKVMVVGDEGINKKVDTKDWQSIVDAVVLGIKNKQITKGLLDAINLSKQLLLKNGYQRKPTDFNELGDSLRIE